MTSTVKQEPVINMPINLPKGMTVNELTSMFNTATTEYTTAFRRAKQLDMIDKGKLWKSINAKFPKYQLLPDTNQVTYVKSNILASIYTVGKSAQILPTSEQDKDIVMDLNLALEKVWDTLDVPYYEMLAGERAALTNLGITQVGWDNNIVSGTKDNFYKGNVRLKNINPLKYMRDPFSTDLDTARWCCTWDDFHESILSAHAAYSKEFKRLKDGGLLRSTSQAEQLTPDSDKVSASPTGKPGYYRVYTYWVRSGKNISEIHLLNNQYPLQYIEAISPALFPFAELYCNIPSGDLIGTSEPAKIAANSVAYNIMQSIILTADYKNQRPPRFINAQAQLNVNAFTQHGNDADHTFVVQGDASKAVHYHQFPQVSQQLLTSMGVLSNDMQLVSGVDGRYTGRDTGSILTTGGVSNMLDQVTMIDAPKVINYERYAKTLSQLILFNYINHSVKRNYYVKVSKSSNKYKQVQVAFDDIPADIVFNYAIAISSELPKNKARIESVANKLMEMQMQYSGAGVDVDIITPEEWLSMQDIPNREAMVERMGIQRSSNWYSVVAQTITQYGNMIDQGVPSDKAMQATAETLAQQMQPGNANMEDVAQQTQMM